MLDTTQCYSRAELDVRQAITTLLTNHFGDRVPIAAIQISYPPDQTLGDFTVACFAIAKTLGQAPATIAQEAAAALIPVGLITKIVPTGPYINFSVDRLAFTKLVLTEISKNKRYGSARVGKGHKVMVEFFSPNTNKPLTIGHVRNACLGSGIVNLLRFLGYKVIDTTLYNDRGIAVTKAMAGYQKWGNNQTPADVQMKPDHFVGSFYVKFSQAAETDPQLEQEAKSLLQDWERGDKDVLALWQKMMTWVHEGFAETLAKLQIEDFEKKYYESEYYRLGKEVIDEGLRQGVFRKHPEGYIYADLEKFNMPNKILLRSDGTSLYITQDLYLASLKNRFKLDESIYVVASEQDLQFKQLFKILELLGFANIKRNYHLSYGMVRLPSGKIKSRQGLIPGTGADDLLAQLDELARIEITNREPGVSVEELTERSHQIALAALKFYILGVKPETTMVFDPQQSITFTGRTGPYLQYTHARISSVLAKATDRLSLRLAADALSEPVEFALVRCLAQFPQVVAMAAEHHDPSDVAEYAYQVAKAVSALYESVPILQAEQKLRRPRLVLLQAAQRVLATSLELLGIPAPEKM